MNEHGATELPEDAPLIVVLAELVRQVGAGVKQGFVNSNKQDAEELGVPRYIEAADTVVAVLYLRAAFRAAKRGDVAKTVFWSALGARLHMSRQMRRSRALAERQMDVLIDAEIRRRD